MIDVRTILKTKKPFWGDIKQYIKCNNNICHLKLHYLHICQIIISPYFISSHAKSQVVLSTDWIFVTIILCVVISYSLSIYQRFLDNQFYQLRIILVYLGTVNAECKMMAYNLS